MRGPAAMLLFLVGPAALPAAEPPRAIVLVTIDTLRADHLGAYGYKRPTSPFLDRLAGEGVLFENAFASSSMTAACHASLFTGLHPPQHGVRLNDEGFSPQSHRRFRTLAETLAGVGYATGAFSGVGFLNSIAQGFDTVEAGSGDYLRYRQADAVVDRALAWLGKRKRDDRFFLWIHLFDVHPPRRLPPHDSGRLLFESAAAAEQFARDAVERRGVTPGAYRSPAALALSYAQYDTEIAFVDQELGRLFDRMEAMHLDERALWIVTADHGEGLGNHDWLDHVRFLYNEAVRVPLIVYADERWEGRRVRDLVRHVDVMPTLLAILGLPFEQPGFTSVGRSLLPLLDGVKVAPAMSFSVRRPWGSDHRDWERGEVFALQDLDWKYIAHTDGKDEFFDLRSDPLELRNLVEAPSPVRDRLSEMTREVFAALRREGQVATKHTEPAVTDELKALGYIH
jgi:arylsulfatase A-like enzyme